MAGRVAAGRDRSAREARSHRLRRLARLPHAVGDPKPAVRGAGEDEPLEEREVPGDPREPLGVPDRVLRDRAGPSSREREQTRAVDLAAQVDGEELIGGLEQIDLDVAKVRTCTRRTGIHAVRMEDPVVPVVCLST